ncbi:hypothetical protein G7Z17_g8185 [Cylindrodendrum hubeiense]|uniref:Uncharacterized protein n=1 Tax=Cylindrodendrum hubeiense TaxID=595255 RepID=A0A9P5HA43_9HYPO|nr:hypothetical protein G7Z17_g8185 [Cylindrodendrum hubeiense]
MAPFPPRATQGHPSTKGHQVVVKGRQVVVKGHQGPPRPPPRPPPCPPRYPTSPGDRAARTSQVKSPLH